jgi:hypothetical protein
MSDDRLINQIGFEDDGIAIQYLDSTDIRIGGKVTVAKQISISRAHPDYGEDMEALYRKAQRLLANVLEDFENSEPYLPDDDEDDDDKGMGDH